MPLSATRRGTWCAATAALPIAAQTRRDGARRLTNFVRDLGSTPSARTRTQSLSMVRGAGAAPGATRRQDGPRLPSGFATDAGTAPLRRFVFDRAAVDTLTEFDNREGIFPIYRSVGFDLVTCTTGRPTTAIACRVGIDATCATRRRRPSRTPAVTVTRAFLARLSGDDDLGIPELSINAISRSSSASARRRRGSRTKAAGTSLRPRTERHRRSRRVRAIHRYIRRASRDQGQAVEPSVSGRALPFPTAPQRRPSAPPSRAAPASPTAMSRVRRTALP